jgi:hypothetical protein
MFIRKQISSLSSKFMRYALSLLGNEIIWGVRIMRNKLWRVVSMCAHLDDSERAQASSPWTCILKQCGHLRPDKTRCNHLLPHGPDTRHSRAGNHPFTARKHINVMITLTTDKLARWGWGSPPEIRSAKDPDGQHWDGSPFPRALHPPRNAVPGHDDLNSATGRHLLAGTMSMPVSYSP